MPGFCNDSQLAIQGRTERDAWFIHDSGQFPDQILHLLRIATLAGCFSILNFAVLSMKRLLLAFSPLLFFSILFFNSKTVEITAADRNYIRAFSNEWHLKSNADSIHRDFASELQFIKTLQDSVITNIKHQEIAHRYFGDMAFYFKKRVGFCYDRSVLMEKILSFYGFAYRHVFLYFSADTSYPSYMSFFKRGIPSHALFEVKTKKGWMTVGSNNNWLGLTNNDEVLDIVQTRKRAKENRLTLKYPCTIGEPFWKTMKANYRVVYGVFSRHGDFFEKDVTNDSSLVSGRFHILPDYNLRMLLYNL
jgi:hypothetical protein